ncbi:proactivator polypeptide-like 1 [Fukomys damarensis]|uniref:Proactivator polypeptide-like 1 n=1 Tax=Fukomys damarensis TaxID=885580 RepID=A0A091D5K2_FUKDA|nr:proactivator polypeptide-like 1 [Fukomys damarensis]KFO25738.1 Proactivator polypeptide-like 1 [Fukomys damarensis]
MLLTLLLLPSLLGAATGGPVPGISGPPDCARGSRVWCQDLQAAVKCGAVGHCQEAVWSKPTAKSLHCEVCQDVVAATGNGLNPAATDSEILTSLVKTCEWLPGQESSARCRQMVAAHGPALLGMLRRAPGSAPAQVCSALTLCEPLQRLLAAPGAPLTPGGALEVVAPFLANGALTFHPRSPAPVPEDAVCQNCIQLISRLQDTNLTLAEVSIWEQCESLASSLALLCKNYIHQLFVPTEQALRVLPPREVCRKGGFCEELRGPAQQLAQVAAVDGLPPVELELPKMTSEVQMQSGLTCEVCLGVITEMDQWLLSNGTEAFISHSLERVCTIMPPSIMQQCVVMVDTYSPALVELVTKITPEKVCQTIRLCSRRRRARSLSRGPPATPAPPPSPVLLDEENQGSFCNSCKRLFHLSSENLELKSTKRDILMAFKGGCSILPLPYRIECNRFVTQYEPVFIQSVKEMIDPVAVCKKVGACHAPKTPLLGTDQCVLGPSFWCRSREAAELCNAVEHCQRQLWKQRHHHARVHP